MKRLDIIISFVLVLAVISCHNEDSNIILDKKSEIDNVRDYVIQNYYNGNMDKKLSIKRKLPSVFNSAEVYQVFDLLRSPSDYKYVIYKDKKFIVVDKKKDECIAYLRKRVIIPQEFSEKDLKEFIEVYFMILYSGYPPTRIEAIKDISDYQKDIKRLSESKIKITKFSFDRNDEGIKCNFYTWDYTNGNIDEWSVILKNGDLISTKSTRLEKIGHFGPIL